MTRLELMGCLAQNYPTLSRKDLRRAIDLIFDQILTAVLRGQRVEIRHFGSFFLRAHPGSSLMRHPASGAIIHRAPYYRLQFMPSKALRQRINQPQGLSCICD